MAPLVRVAVENLRPRLRLRLLLKRMVVAILLLEVKAAKATRVCLPVKASLAAERLPKELHPKGQILQAKGRSLRRKPNLRLRR